MPTSRTKAKNPLLFDSPVLTRLPGQISALALMKEQCWNTIRMKVALPIPAKKDV